MVGKICFQCIMAVLLMVRAVESGGGENGNNPGGIFAGGGVVDLGGHIVSYYLPSDGEISKEYKDAEYFAIRDLDGEEVLYLPNDFGEILDIRVADGSGIDIEYENGGTVWKTSIPICFPNRRKGAWEILPVYEGEKIIYGTKLRESVQAEKIWTESMTAGGEDYIVTFERISPPYRAVNSVVGARMADYLISVADGEGNTVWQQEMINFPVQFEEVYWLKDISNDGCPDIIFCVAYESMPKAYANLCFLVWDSEREGFVLEKHPGDSMWGPRWDGETSALMFYTEGFNHWIYDWKVFGYGKGGWELCAEIITDSEDRDIPYFEDYAQEEMYYKRLEYYIKEIYYEGGKIVRENRVESWDDSVWEERKENALLLYPQGWEKEEITLGTGVTINKYIRPDRMKDAG